MINKYSKMFTFCLSENKYYYQNIDALAALILFCKVRPTCKTDKIVIADNDLNESSLTAAKFNEIRKIFMIK